MTSGVRVVEAYLESFAAGEADGIVHHVTDDFVNEHLSELGSGCVGREEYHRRLPAFLEMFGGARYTVVAMVSDGEAQVVVRYRFEAEYHGTSIDVPGMMWFELRDGLIATRTDLWDSLTFLRQTGQAD